MHPCLFCYIPAAPPLFYSLSLHDALPISILLSACGVRGAGKQEDVLYVTAPQTFLRDRVAPVYSRTGSVRNGEMFTERSRDRKSTRLNSSHVSISYAVFCLKKQNRLPSGR